MPSYFSWLALGLFKKLTLDCAYTAKTLKKRRKKGQHRLTKRQCVISTGYKSYFLAILINVKLFDEEHHG